MPGLDLCLPISVLLCCVLLSLLSWRIWSFPWRNWNNQCKNGSFSKQHSAGFHCVGN